MVRAIVVGALIATVGFSGGAIADVSFKGLDGTLKRADSQFVSGLMTGAKPGTIVLRAR